MYVCLCQAITKKKLCLLIKKGCNSLPKLQKECEIGISCGTCLKEARKILANETKKTNSKNSSTKTVELNNSQHPHLLLGLTEPLSNQHGSLHH